MSELLSELKRAMAESGKTRYRLAKESGVAESALCRLVSGERGLSVEAAEKLADAMGLRVVLQPKEKTKGR